MFYELSMFYSQPYPAATPCGAIYNTQGCHELTAYVLQYIFEKYIFKLSSNLKENCYEFFTGCRKLHFSSTGYINQTSLGNTGRFHRFPMECMA